MNPTMPNPDLTKSIIPRSLHPEFPKAEDAPPPEFPEAYPLIAVDEPGTDSAPATAENEPNELLEMVEETVMNDAVLRKVPNDERSKVGTEGPLIT